MTEYRYPELDETQYQEVLPNGLTIRVIPRRDFQRSIAYLVTDFGSIHTEFTLDGQAYSMPAGIAHYLEHKMFDLPDGRDVTAEFAAMGAHVNAFTSYDMTAYYFSTTQKFTQCLRLLLEFVMTPYFTEESVAKEQGIIDQEIGMNLDAPESVIFDTLTAGLYENHPIRVPILGTSESIRRITPEDLYTCHRAFYTPGNMLLCVIGDVDPEAVKTIALELLGTETHSVGIKRRDWPEAMTALEPEMHDRMEVSMPTFEMAFKCEPLGVGDEAIRQELVADLAAEVLFGESSELYLRLYEEGKIDASFGGGFETVDGCAMLLCSGDSEAPLEVRDAILAQKKRLQLAGIPDDVFLRLKRSALGRRIRALDSFDGTCFRMCAYHFADFDYFRFPEIYRSIEKQELLTFLRRVVTRERCAISILTPLEADGSEV